MGETQVPVTRTARDTTANRVDVGSNPTWYSKQDDAICKRSKRRDFQSRVRGFESHWRHQI